MDTLLTDHLNPLDVDRLRASFQSARPQRYVVIDHFLADHFAREVMHAYPTFAEARDKGRQFRGVNEAGKVQVTSSSYFDPTVARLDALLRHPRVCALISRITGIPMLLADDELTGGGMHLMPPGAQLDVHVDFNRLRSRGWYRRVNLLIYLNDPWPQDWGGELELWDADVRSRWQHIYPQLNRCVIFETNRSSYHGVGKVRCPRGVTRKSFSTYYYTATPPFEDDGTVHDTIFRPRPSEWLKGWALMPAERAARSLTTSLRRLKSQLGRRIGRP